MSDKWINIQRAEIAAREAAKRAANLAEVERRAQAARQRHHGR